MKRKDIIITNKLTETQKADVATISYSAFGEKYRAFLLFNDDEESGIECLKELINYESGLYAVRDNQVLGFIALEHGKTRYMSFKFAAFKKSYGCWGAIRRTIFAGIKTSFFSHGGKNTAHIEAVAVLNDVRGMGVGTMLLNASFETVAKLGFSKITLEVVDTNPRAKKLYEKMGFVALKYRKYGFITASAGFTGSTHMCKTIN